LPNIELRSQKAAQQYSRAVLDCLQRAWKPLIVRAGVKFVPAVMYAVNQGSKTACGTFGKEDDGYYCAADSGIYLDWDELFEQWEYGRVAAQIYIQFVMAHEFGHHVQQLVGITTYYDDRWEHANGAARLEQMRRHELQASCFGSAFLGANRTILDLFAVRLLYYQNYAYAGDDDPPPRTPDHGSHASSQAWAQAAFTAKSPAACNTWVVPAKRVS
jgi:predicted metalloprotease